MRSAAAAFGWEFRARHRWGMIGVVVYMIVLGGVKLVVIARGIPIYLDSGESFAFVVMVPLTATATYFLAVFTFGLDGDLAARQSMRWPSARSRRVCGKQLSVKSSKFLRCWVGQ